MRLKCIKLSRKKAIFPGEKQQKKHITPWAKMPSLKVTPELRNSYSRDNTKFVKAVYALCREIPAGKVTTYKEISKALEMDGCQAIGQALKRNPYAPQVPCHRVVKSSGMVGGFKGKTSGEEIREKIGLLEREGVRISKGKIDFKKYLFKF